ncbi:hypothetical protein ACEPAI_2796 [Sanghuangporus weigelae]
MGLLSVDGHKLLVANRGEIAVRILRTAKRLGLQTVAVYTHVDSTSPHVLLADEAVALVPSGSAGDEKGVTLVAPGYGFLAENPDFARLLAKHDVTLLGPDVQTIEDMGLKHRARELAVQADVPVVPGTNGIEESADEAELFAEKVGYPVILKATAGGGGMGLSICGNAAELREKFNATQQRAKNLFHNEGVFIEKFLTSSRHIEVQIFGDSRGHVIHIGERECSVQRRHQKIIEEAPSPFFLQRQDVDLREKMCAAAVRLGKLVNYKSAGTVEFLVDDITGNFYFLEMNTRLQVEHGVTEMLHPGLDLVELMILQGLSERRESTGYYADLLRDQLDQEKFAHPRPNTHSVELRVYCENPAMNFSPTPGILQYVEFPEETEDLRIDTWVSTGMVVTPFYDPLVAKVILERPNKQGSRKHVVIQGPPNNIPFLKQVLDNETFKTGRATTEWIDRGGLRYINNAMTVISPGINTSIQSLPARDIGLGIPPSGPMDTLAFRAGNVLVGNPSECEGLELVIPPKGAGRSSGLTFNALFHVKAIVAITGANASVHIDGREVPTWARLVIPSGAKLTIGSLRSDEGGLRTYLTICGGFPSIPKYLGSKSTSMGSGGGHQGRNLQGGDMLDIQPYTKDAEESPTLPTDLIPKYLSEWTLHSLPGPHDDTEFLTAEGIEAFYARKWKVSSASNRMGIRLEAVHAEGDDIPALLWARQNGGEGGSHPSNILDNGYARGSVNLNGDTPVILTNEGPSMGGYLCISTIATAEQWKLGQLRPSDLVQFKRITYSDAVSLHKRNEELLENIAIVASGTSTSYKSQAFSPSQPSPDPKLHYIPGTLSKPKVVFRQAGDSGILVEYGEMTLDFTVRARIHGFETAARQLQLPGIVEFAPCIRSTMVHYDPLKIPQKDLLRSLIQVEMSLPDSIEDMQFPGRRLTFPIVLDDKWNRETLQRYMSSVRDRAVYLPSNVEYLARNNGIEGGAEQALKLLVSSPWLVFGVGFYLACPFLVPIDPRCRLVGQKMNPSRTYTPRGAVGIAGLVAAIYPVESPGGYQLFGRTLSSWQPWGKGPDFAPERPWLLDPFDQVSFESITEEQYIQLEKEFDGGRYAFKVEPVTLSMKEYLSFVASVRDEIDAFKERQAKGTAAEEAHETALLKEWQESKRTEDGGAIVTTQDTEETPNFASASLAGTVWKIKTTVGDVIKSPDQAVMILEAMKTEINVMAGEDNVGLRVSGFAKGVREGTTVQAGDRLVYFVEQ